MADTGLPVFYSLFSNCNYYSFVAVAIICYCNEQCCSSSCG